MQPYFQIGELRLRVAFISTAFKSVLGLQASVYISSVYREQLNSSLTLPRSGPWTLPANSSHTTELSGR